jgi:hypothetical protein
MCTALFWATTSPPGAVTSASSVVIGPTSQVKKAGVMRALTSAPHPLYGNARRNQGGTEGKPETTASRCCAAVRPFISARDTSTIPLNVSLPAVQLRGDCHPASLP